NPASMYGHTFLRVNKATDTKPDEKRMELLDFGIGYGANVTTSDPFSYALFGLMGLFDGTFTNVPYYYKVREYNNFESRDLWSYELALTEDELDTLVAHFWEIGETAFPYFYLTRNCSYYLLSVIEAAAPRLQLLSKIPFWVIPSDTVQALTETPDLVSKVSY